MPTARPEAWWLKSEVIWAVQDDDLVGGLFKKGREETGRGRTAAYPHAVLRLPVDDRGSADLQVRLAPFLMESSTPGDWPGRNGPGHGKAVFSGQAIHPAHGQNLGAVFLGLHHAHRPPVKTDFGPLLPDGHVGVHFDFYSRSTKGGLPSPR